MQAWLGFQVQGHRSHIGRSECLESPLPSPQLGEMIQSVKEHHRFGGHHRREENAGEPEGQLGEDINLHKLLLV